MRVGLLTLILSGTFAGLYSTGARVFAPAPRAQIEPRTLARTMAWEFVAPEDPDFAGEFAHPLALSEAELALAESRFYPAPAEDGWGRAYEEVREQLAISDAWQAVAGKLEVVIELPGFVPPVRSEHLLVTRGGAGAVALTGNTSTLPHSESSAHTVILPRVGELQAARFDTSVLALALSYYSNRNGYIRKYA